MFFTSEKSRAKEILHFLHKKFKYNSDLLIGKKLEQYQQLEQDVQAYLHNSGNSGDSGAGLRELEERVNKLFPEEKNAGTRENIEVLFVAVVIALALRTFFLQPFVIPTDSMKPTLYGIPTERTEANPPGVFKQALEFALYGRNYVQVHVEKGGRVKEISETGWFGIDLLGKIPFVDRTRLVIGDQTYILPGTPTEFEKGTEGYRGPRTFLSVGTEVPDNSTPVNYVFGAGDHVFVNKFVYHFRKPERGDVFVFTTENIRRIQQSLSGGITAQFYIKRCVGLPGDELQTKPPYLYNNGKILDTRPIFQKIYSGKDGYEGYSVDNPQDPRMLYLGTPNETYHISKNNYWAMGDNSYHSFDSRYWGPVPAENLVGTGLLVYWPFSSRWGLIP